MIALFLLGHGSWLVSGVIGHGVEHNIGCLLVTELLIFVSTMVFPDSESFS